MYQRDWLDELRWSAVLLGVLAAVLGQVVITLLLLKPLGLTVSWIAVALVELCIVAGAFVAGWFARRAATLNGLITAMISAVVALVTTALRAPTTLNALNMLFLFATFALMGTLGGLAAGRLQARRLA